MKNPFKYGCVVSGDSFCERPDLAAKLAGFVRSGQNVVIQGERRMGKTSLVRETIGRMRGIRLVYVDLLGVCDVADLCGRIAEGLAETDRTLPFYRKLGKMLVKLRPTVSVDPDSGMPVFSLDKMSAGSTASLDAILYALAKEAKCRRLCVVFDEFQDILGMKDGTRTLAVMRGKIQLDASTPYVFLGSVRNKMTDIFWDPDSPFYHSYHSAAALPVGEIPDGDFYRFALEKFKAGGRELPMESFDAILKSAQRIPGYVQELCDAIWDSTDVGDAIRAKEIDEGLMGVFARERDHYEIFMERLTPIQRKVVSALAVHGGRGVYSGAFLASAQVSGIGTMRRSITKLISEKLIYRYNDEYKFFNPFFAQWLAAAAHR
ncbi:MAG: ATP-binding protein [Kiritimatiellae bacterium]|nr:ATP-binding protein [Kiritimatiellia bacterium]